MPILSQRFGVSGDPVSCCSTDRGNRAVLFWHCVQRRSTRNEVYNGERVVGSLRREPEPEVFGPEEAGVVWIGDAKEDAAPHYLTCRIQLELGHPEQSKVGVNGADDQT